MALSGERKKEIITTWQQGPNDNGSAAVQVAMLTHRIREINTHLNSFRKDHASRRGLLKLVGQRRRLMRYLANTDPQTLQKLKATLEIK